MKKRMALSLITCAVAPLFVLAGCGQGNAGTQNSGSGNNSSSSSSGNSSSNGSNSSNGTTASSLKPVTIQFAVWDTGTALQYEKDVVAAFEKAHPNIHVQVEAYGSGFDEKMAASFGAGDPPDVEYMWNLPQYAPSLQPLGQFISNDPEAQQLVKQFYPNVMTYNKYLGKVLSLPLGYTTHVIYYNKKLFQAANVPFPTDGWTWQQFVSDAKKLTNPAKHQYGFVYTSTPDPYDSEAWIWSNGGSWVSSDGKTIKGVLNSPENAQVFTDLYDLAKNKYAVITGSNSKLGTNDIFAQGSAAMEADGIWPLAQYQKAKMDIGTVTYPSFNGKPVKNVIDASGIAMSKDSKHKQAAWTFMKFFASQQSEQIRKADLPVLPSVAQNFNGKNLLNDPVYGAFYQGIKQATDTPAFLVMKNWNQVASNIGNSLSAIMLGKQSAQQALNQAVSESQRYMQ